VLFAESCRISVWELDARGERIAQPVSDELVASAQYAPVEPWKTSTTYEWQVVASNRFGDSPSATWTFRTQDPPPALPGSDIGLVEPAIGFEVASEEVVLDWEPSSVGSTQPEYYSLYLWEADGSEPRLEAHLGSATEYRTLTLESGTGYFWQVVAVNSEGEAAGPVWSFSIVQTFRRGDVDADGVQNITDPVRTLNYLFLGDAAPPCLKAADFDDNGRIEITDAVAGLLFLFAGGPGPTPPGADCGVDATEDALGCEAAPTCGAG
jgi:hypothetical protein